MSDSTPGADAVLVVGADGTCPAVAVAPSLFTVESAADWSAVARALTSDAPPSVLAVCVASISGRGAAAVTSFAEQGVLPTTVLCGACVAKEHLRDAWCLANWTDYLVLSSGELRETVEAAAKRSSAVTIGEYVLARYEVKSSTIRGFIRGLAICQHAWTRDVRAVAESLGSSRSTLYAELTRESVPSIARWQMFFRLMCSLPALQRGASPESAAFQVGLTDAASLRRALRRHFGVSIRQVRTESGWRWLADRWIEVHRHAG